MLRSLAFNGIVSRIFKTKSLLSSDHIQNRRGRDLSYKAPLDGGHGHERAQRVGSKVALREKSEI
jgi:hypothetical protein